MIAETRRITVNRSILFAMIVVMAGVILTMAMAADTADGDSSSATYEIVEGINDDGETVSLLKYGPLDAGIYYYVTAEIDGEDLCATNQGMAMAFNGYIYMELTRSIDEDEILIVSIGTTVGGNQICADVPVVSKDVEEVTLEIEIESKYTVGDTDTIGVVTVPGSLANYLDIDFTCSDESVISLNGNTIEAVSAGKATVTATAIYSGKTIADSVEIQVTSGSTGDVHVTGVKLNQTTANLEVDGEITLTATVQPEDATNKNVTWASSDSTVATVDNGTVTAKAVGTTTITVTTEDGGFTATCTVTVVKKPAPALTGITVTGPTVRAYEVGEILNLGGLTVTVHYNDGSSTKIEEGYTVTPGEGAPDLNEPYKYSGTYTYTVSYQGMTSTFEVTVSDRVFTITYGDSENGTVSGDTRVVEGGDAKYTVRADYGFVIGSITVGGVPIYVESGMTSYSGTISKVGSDITVSATFVSDVIGTVTVTAVDHGSVGAGGASSAQVTIYGHWDSTVSIKADYGYYVSPEIESDLVNGEITYADGILTIAAGSEVTEITISFEKIPVTDDDDEEYVPPVIVVRPDSGDDDTTTYIVAIAAAAVVAILAALILMQTRKS